MMMMIARAHATFIALTFAIWNVKPTVPVKLKQIPSVPDTFFSPHKLPAIPPPPQISSATNPSQMPGVPKTNGIVLPPQIRAIFSPTTEPQLLTQAPVLPHCEEEEWESKTIDVTLYGATGTLGQKCREYLADHPSKPQIAFAGRSESKMTQLHTTYSPSKYHNVQVLPAMNLTDESKLLDMAKKTRVILNMVGPNERSGSDALIRAALDGCAHYVDVTVETHWKRFMLQQYSHVAKARGLAIVQSAGFTSLVPDLLIATAAKLLTLPPDDVVMGWSELDGIITDGFKNASQDDLITHGPVIDPYILAPLTPDMARVDSQVAEWDTKDETYLRMKISQYFGAQYDCPVIRRSMHIMFPGKAVSVREVRSKSAFIPEKIISESYPFRLQKSLKTGSFAGEALASHGIHEESIQFARVSVTGKGDPAVTGSSMVAAELALGLASRGILTDKAGFLTPALALGDPEILKERLQNIQNGQFIQFSNKLSPAKAVHR